MLIALFGSLYLTLNVVAQCPTVRIESRLHSVLNINAEMSEDFTCRLYRYAGRVSGFEYGDDTELEPAAFILELASGRRIWIGLPEDLLECFSQVEQSHWNAQFIKRARVKVVVWQCGAAGRGDAQLNRIEFR